MTMPVEGRSAEVGAEREGTQSLVVGGLASLAAIVVTFVAIALVDPCGQGRSLLDCEAPGTGLRAANLVVGLAVAGLAAWIAAQAFAAYRRRERLPSLTVPWSWLAAAAVSWLLVLALGGMDVGLL